LDEDGKVTGAKAVYGDGGFHRYQQICGNGCGLHQIQNYMGPSAERIATGIVLPF